MKLIGKQIVVELPGKKACNPKGGCHERKNGYYCAKHEIFNDALSEVAKMNQAWEVDVEILKDTIRPIFDKFREIPYEESRMSLMLTCRHIDILTNDIAHALASDPSKWMKRKEST